jgi:hypothetical protein
MAKTSPATPLANLTGQANTSNNAGQSALNAQHLMSSLPSMPVLPTLPEMIQSDAKDAKYAEELLEDTLVLEDAPKVVETDTLGDVVMAQASVPAAAAATEAASATAAVASAAAPAATATGFAGMSGLGLLGAVAGAVGVAAVVNNSGSNSPVVPAEPLFSVSEVDGVVSFSGVATGDITVSVVDGVATFSRGGSTATTTVESLSDKSINIAAGQTLVMTGETMDLESVEGVKIIGAGAFKINATDDGTDTATDLKFVLNVDLTGAQSSLTFDMTDDNQDRITLKVGSSIDLAGGNLIVSDGTLDAKLVAAGSFRIEGDVILNSGLALTVTQLKSVTGKLSTSGEGALEIVVSTVAEAQELAGLLASRAPEGADAKVPTVTFSVQAEDAVIDAVELELNERLSEIGTAVGQPIDASAIVSVVYILTLEAAIARVGNIGFPESYVINDTALNFEVADSVESAKDQVVQIEEILANAKASVPAIADIVSFKLADLLDVLGSDSSAAVIALASSVTVSDAVGSELAATEFSALGGRTTGTVTVSNALNITGTAQELMAALVTTDTLVVAKLAAVTFTDIPTQDELTAIKGATSANDVTFAFLSLEDALALFVSGGVLPEPGTYNMPNGEVDLETVTVVRLKAIDAHFAILEERAVNQINVIDITATFVIADTAANLLAVDGQDVIDGARAVVVIDDAGTILTAADLKILADQEAGPVTVTNAMVITGSVADLTAALVTPGVRVVAKAATVVVNDVSNVGSDESAAISLIAGATSGVITVNGTVEASTLDFSNATFSSLTVNGGLGDDVISGSAGANTLNTLTGGGGQDTFVIAQTGAGTVITDFTGGVIDEDVGADIFKFTGDLKSINGTSNNIIYQADDAGTALNGNTVIFELLDLVTTGTADDLILKLGATAINADINSGDSMLFLNYFNDGNGSQGAQVWTFIDGSGGNVDVGELNLLSTLSNVVVDSLDYTNYNFIG